MLDYVEHDGYSVGEALQHWQRHADRSPPPMLVGWVAKAVRHYLSASAGIAWGQALPDESELTPVSRNWGRRRQFDVGDGGEVTHEEVVSGRRFEGSGVRELRLLRTRSVRDRARDEAEIALVAGVVASAGVVLSGMWEKRPLALRSAPGPHRVRVVEIGCSDGSYNVLFEGTTQQAHEKYRRDAEPAVVDAASGIGYLPGPDCGGCDLIGLCPAVPVRPGLLGVDGSSLPRRSWSLSSGRSFDECPARLVAERLFLPRERTAEDSDYTRRGQAVHAWLEDLHRREPARTCATDEIPPTPDEWSAGRWSVAGEQARLGVQMIADHTLTCALRGPAGHVEAHPELPVVVFDSKANVVVVAKMDLLYRSGDVWSVRETKTVSALDESDLLTQFPQLALAVVLSAEDGIQAGERVRVELERLSASGPVTGELDVDDPEVVAAARTVVRARAEAWHASPSLTAKPGKVCTTCPFNQWCPESKA
ncbi:PD-(D/E)XK nuclease family protein [Actinosynnema sp. NPDC047251]|uniref:PD-(D/E)XK nuclease family protein n=1 Tax=Saccharothrix espanaensis TaxID=103731 RepID=UPI0018D309F5|nr:PD-(D/E)XK nuclease family protein [Saccharothrix espanaensis]